MKRPQELNFYPLDTKQDKDGTMWFRVPAWLVRAYRLNKGLLMGRVKMVIRENKRPPVEYHGEETGLRWYFRTNWQKKLIKEKRKKADEK